MENSSNHLEYETILRQKNGSFFAVIKELGIIVEGTDADQAFNQAQKQKEKFFDDMKKIDASQSIPLPRQQVKREKFNFNWKHYFGIGLTTMLIVFFTTGAVSFLVGHQMNKVGKKISSVMTASDLKKSERVERFKKFLKESKPYLKELNLALKELD